MQLISSAGVTGGAALVYSVSNVSESFDFVQTLTNAKLMEGDMFGYSVSICGNYVVVGAPENDSDESNTGAAYIFERGVDTDETFSLVFDLLSPEPAISALFGWSVAVNSNGTIVVGAKGDRFAVGSVYVFKPNGSEIWEHVFTLEPNVTASFPTLGNAGWDVAIDEE